MRPLAISVQAFGSYAQSAEVDFERLDEHRFFLVCGPTGAGKTTLFDAISFALYGETSGGERDGAQMRSDLAEPLLPTSVGLDFALGEVRYRVTRAPRQSRPKQRGEGLTLVEPRAQLWRLTGAAPAWGKEGEGDERLLASGMRATTERVEGLLGFRADQFRQVVLLPQGRFERLLKADSKERQRLLEALFDTARFARLEEALREEARRARREVEGLTARQRAVVAEGAGEDEGALRGRCQALGPLIAEREARRSTLEQALATALEAQGQGRQLAERFEEHERALQALAALRAQARARSGERERLEAARRAAPLAERRRATEARRREREEAAERLRRAGEQLERSEEAEQLAAVAFFEEEQREETRGEAAVRLREFEAMGEQIEHLEVASERLRSVEGALDEAGRRWGEARARYGALSAEAAELVEAEARARRAEQQLGAQKDAAETAARALRQRQDLDDQRRRFDELSASHKRVKARHGGLSDEVCALKERLSRLERAWLAGQAAVLARRLEAGAACPVCGATDHPQPAQADLELPEEELLERLRLELDQLEAERQSLQAALELSQGERAQAKARVEALVEVLGLFSRQPVALFAEQARSADAALREQQALAQGASRLSEERAEVERQRDAAADEVEGAEAQRGELRVELSSLRALVDERRRGVPEALRGAGALGEALERARRRQGALARAFEAAAHARQQTRAQLQVVRSQHESAEAALQEAQRRCRAQEEELEEGCREAGFADEEALAAASLPAQEERSLAAEVERLEAHLVAARERALRAAAAVEGEASPDLLALGREVVKLRGERDELLEALTAARIERRDGEARLRRLEQIAAALEAAEARYQRVGRVADVATGKNPQRITLQRFVLASLLEDVLIAASERLRKMTRGRFSLGRSQSVRGGLDLEVSDSATGTVRSPATLSGGETFLASLALALGLADVVQARAGGVRLETIFVDEGFGGLDPEALEQALLALGDLQRSGKRIGIISHVPELRERIDARLEVVPGPRGSRVKVVLP